MAQVNRATTEKTMDTFHFLPTVFIENPWVFNDIIHLKKNIAGNMEVSETVIAAAATAALRAINSTQP